MIAYWIAFFAPVMAVLSPLRATPAFRRFVWIAVGLYFTLFIGLRHEVGADWINYLIEFNTETVPWADPSYAFLNWAFLRMGLDIHAVNLVCATIFVAGLLSFCREQPRPWLAVAIAVPYLLIVVAMGYTKQAVSLGILLWGLGRLEKGEIKIYFLAVALASTFHATAIVCSVFAAPSARKKSQRVMLGTISLIVTIAIVYVTLQYNSLLIRVGGVIENSSSGAEIRLAMNVAALGALLLFRKRWRQRFGSIEVWVWMGGLSVVGLALIPFSSTAVDRVALYFSPIQIVVWSRIPTLVAGRMARTQMVMIILLSYAAVLGLWLNFGRNAWNWLPYQNVLVDWLLP